MQSLTKLEFYKKVLIPAGQLLTAANQMFKAQGAFVTDSKTAVPLPRRIAMLTYPEYIDRITHMGFEMLHLVNVEIQSDDFDRQSAVDQENAMLGIQRILDLFIDRIASAIETWVYYSRDGTQSKATFLSAVLENPQELQLMRFSHETMDKIHAALSCLHGETCDAVQAVHKALGYSSMNHAKWLAMRNALSSSLASWRTLVRNSNWSEAASRLGCRGTPTVRWVGSEVGRERANEKLERLAVSDSGSRVPKSITLEVLSDGLVKVSAQLYDIRRVLRKDHPGMFESAEKCLAVLKDNASVRRALGLNGSLDKAKQFVLPEAFFVWFSAPPASYVNSATCFCEEIAQTVAYLSHWQMRERNAAIEAVESVKFALSDIGKQEVLALARKVFAPNQLSLLRTLVNSGKL